jgi:hypothetical protein
MYVIVDCLHVKIEWLLVGFRIIYKIYRYRYRDKLLLSNNDV